jgi:hypothetical protein
MGFLRSTTSALRKAILIGWAFGVMWIYLGSLVNFHQHHIWGKQLIPVACSSTRAKDKDSSSSVKDDGSFAQFGSVHHFDFSTPDVQEFNIFHAEIISTYFNLPDVPVSIQGIQAFSLRGPPTA